MELEIISIHSGKKLPVTIGAAKHCPDAIPLYALAKFAIEHNMSQNLTRDFAVFLGKHDVRIEVGLRKELVRRNHIVEDFFEVKKINFLIKGKLVEKPAVMVKGASEFILFVFESGNKTLIIS